MMGRSGNSKAVPRLQGSFAWSRAEDQPATGRRIDDTVRHLCSRLEQEVQTTAMHRDDDVGFEFFDFSNDLLEVVGWCRAEVEATDDGVNLLNAGYFLRLPDGIDDADVSAGTDDDETFPTNIETGGVLVHMLIGHDFALQFRCGVMAIVASGSILARRVVHERVGQDLLYTAALDLTRREGMPFDHGWRFTEHGLDFLCSDFAAIKRATLAVLPGRSAADAVAEIIFTAGIELDVRRERVAIFFK